MIPTTTISFGKQLCEVLKLNAAKVTTITIKVQPDALVLVTTEQMLYVDESKEILKMLEYYHLEPNKK